MSFNKVIGMDGDGERGGNEDAAVFKADSEQRRKIFENFVSSLKHQGHYSLAGDIDKCLKKVCEGIEAFEDLYEKVCSATNPSLKEKFESELKKEAQKLRRLREQIKFWLSSGKIKDTSLLYQTRQLIQSIMERYKLIHHELKMKAFSNEGLEGVQKLDPTTRDQEELSNWLVSSIDQLKIQIDQTESELESILAGKRKKLDKGKVERLDELKALLVRHGFHVGKLETVLRMLDNLSMDIDALKKFIAQVNEIRDDVEYYLDANQEPDFEDNEYLYDDIEGLKEFDVIAQQKALANLALLNSAEDEEEEEEGYGTPMCNSSGSDSSVSSIHSKKSSSDPMNDTEYFADSSGNGRSVLMKTNSSLGTPTCKEVGAGRASNSSSSLSGVTFSPSVTSNSASPVIIGYTDCAELNKWLSSPGGTAAELASIPTLKNDPTVERNPSTMDGASMSATIGGESKTMDDHASSHQQSEWTNFKPVSNDAVEENERFSLSSQDGISNVGRSLWAAGAFGTSNSSSSHPIRPLADLNFSPNENSSSQSSKEFPQYKLFPQTPALWTIGVPIAPKPLRLVTATNTKRPPTFACSGACMAQLSARNTCSYWPVVMVPAAVVSLSQPQHVNVVASTSSPNRGSIVSASSNVPGPSHRDWNHKPVLATTTTMPQLEHWHWMLEPSDQVENGNDIQHGFEGMRLQDQRLLLRILRDEKASTTLKAMARDLLYHNDVGISDTNEPDTQEATFSLEQSVAPLGVPLSMEGQFQLQMLGAAHNHLPLAADSERIDQFQPRNMIDTPLYYPQEPLDEVDSIDVYRRYSVDLLFFVFYFKEGTLAQQMAAHVLKERSWTYHTKYLMWFRRLRDPEFQAHDFEMGEYAYFDIERWRIGIMDDFLFEYKYLHGKPSW